MGTLALFAIVAILVAAALFVLAANFLPAGEQIAPVLRDEPIWALPTGRALDPADVAEVRLPVALRGYRFAETDLLLDRLSEELKERNAEIAALRGGLAYPPVFVESFDRPAPDEGHASAVGIEPAGVSIDSAGPPAAPGNGDEQEPIVES